MTILLKEWKVKHLIEAEQFPKKKKKVYLQTSKKKEKIKGTNFDYEQL